MARKERLVTTLAAAVGLLLVTAAGCRMPATDAESAPSASMSVSVDPAQAAAVDQVVKDVMASQHLRAAIVKVSVGGREVITKAYGQSMPGVPATTDMHFRNGAVAISYVAIALLQLVDEGVVNLDDKVSTWLPDLPYGDEVTLGQLAQMTSGYVDYVTAPELTKLLYANPFRTFTTAELIAIGTKRPLLYRPGTNWNYAHTNYVILGLAMEKITGKPMQQLLTERVLGPLGLDNTTDPGTPAITEPALHALSSERRYALKIPAGVPFTEDVTYWNRPGPSPTVRFRRPTSTTCTPPPWPSAPVGSRPATFQQMTTRT
jgi:CubicO group peptidase (beta-lactamase class C family)